MWNKEILMDFKLTYIFILILGLFACSTNKISNWEKDGKEVTIYIQNAMPHCGGMAPDPEIDYPIMDPYIGCTLSVHLANDDGTRGEKVGEILTNHEGKAKISLKKGMYQLWKPSKFDSFSEFMDKESPVKSSNYAYRDEACFQEWYDRPDFELEVTAKPEFSFSYQNRCFTGAHPCMIYSGPYPP